jgi:hypothetical protein
LGGAVEGEEEEGGGEKEGVRPGALGGMGLRQWGWGMGLGKPAEGMGLGKPAEGMGAGRVFGLGHALARTRRASAGWGGG